MVVEKKFKKNLPGNPAKESHRRGGLKDYFTGTYLSTNHQQFVHKWQK
jgi:hypothetical protein